MNNLWAKVDTSGHPTCGSCGTQCAQYPCLRCGYDGLGDYRYQPTARERDPVHVQPAASGGRDV